jgi:proteasome lid subunit RPN8/RPN11
VLRLRRETLEKTFEHLRACGAGRRECVAYWLGPRAEKDEISEVVHPRHSATSTSYDVDGRWLNELWVRLARDELELRAQVHTHPGSAFHSSRDDDMAAIQTAGFASVVIPHFALGGVSLDRSHVERRENDGSWRAVAAADEIEVI